MTPLISILLPNYNHAAFLPQRLQSIYAQTYQNIEVIILDDNSQDNSIDLLKKYQNHPKTSHFVINKKNSGSPFKQWKKGIELAKGDYIWIAESDDYAANDFLEKVVKVAQTDTDIALIYSQSRVVEHSGKLSHSMLKWTNFFKPNKWEKSYINTGNNEVQDYLLIQNTIPNASAVVFKNNKSLSKFIHPTLKYAGDWWFWVQIIQRKKIAFIAEELNYFRSHAATTRNIKTYTLAQKINNIREAITVLKQIEMMYPSIKLKARQQQMAQINRLIPWVKLTELKSIKKFIQEELEINTTFSYLIIRAYWSKLLQKLAQWKAILSKN